MEAILKRGLSMTIKLGVVMDPIQSIKVKHDSTFAMLLEAQQRGWSIFYIEQKDLFLQDGVARAQMRPLQVQDDVAKWFELGEQENQPLQELDVILMRKDPPVDASYIYTTQILELAEKAGVLVTNKPQSLRDFNEKLFISWFPQCCAPTLVTCSAQQMKEFIQEHKEVIVKPLHGMGGVSIFRLKEGDANINVVIELLTKNGKQLLQVQRYIPEIKDGDKRILLIDGKPVAKALARLATGDEFRANMAVGGRGIGAELSKRDYWICEQIGPLLKKNGLLFAGIDVIGDYLTEINITSPTCIRELDAIFSLNISAQLLDCIETKLTNK